MDVSAIQRTTNTAKDAVRRQPPSLLQLRAVGACSAVSRRRAAPFLRNARGAVAAATRPHPPPLRRHASSQAHKVAVLGAAGGIGQPLSLLLKMAPGGAISRLALYDLAPVTPGVAGERARGAARRQLCRASPRRHAAPPLCPRACL